MAAQPVRLSGQLHRAPDRDGLGAPRRSQRLFPQGDVLDQRPAGPNRTARPAEPRDPPRMRTGTDHRQGRAPYRGRGCARLRVRLFLPDGHHGARQGRAGDAQVLRHVHAHRSGAGHRRRGRRPERSRHEAVGQRRAAPARQHARPDCRHSQHGGARLVGVDPAAGRRDRHRHAGRRGPDPRRRQGDDRDRARWPHDRAGRAGRGRRQSRHSQRGQEMSAPTREDLARSGTLEELYGKLAQVGMGPGWAKPTPSLWASPRKTFRPTHWSYQQARGALDAAGRLINTELAERRKLILFNPAEGNTYGTVRTIVAAYQMIMPGEWARVHRHTPNALRLILDAEPGTYTEVDGTNIAMEPGDVLLTPNWSTHGHGNNSKANAYWLDFLDAPLVQLLEPMFFEPQEEDESHEAFE